MRREALTEIARDPSVGARSKLLQSLSDFVFDARLPTEQEVVQLCAVARLLLKVADDDARCHFATTVAPSRHVPREMVFLLLQDKLAIAGPVLRDSPVLTEEDLIGFVGALSEDRLAFVARRKNLGPGFVEILVERGSEVLQLAITENGAAPLSPKSLEILILNAERSESLCRSLVRRPEVSKADAERLVQLITRILKSRMRLPEPAETVAPAPMPELKKQPGRLDIREMTEAVQSGRMAADTAVARLANEDRSNELTTLLSALSRIDDVSIMRLLVRADANGIGMILKALDLSDATFAAVAAFRQRRLRHSDSQMRFERADFAKLVLADCKATLAQLISQRRPH